MRHRLRAFVTLAIAALATITAPAAARSAEPMHLAGNRLVRVRIAAEHSTVTAGSDTLIAVTFAPKPGWHIYWRNPGDSGAPPSIVWSLPRNLNVGAASWPAPERIVTGGIATYVYARPVTLLVPLHVAPTAASGAIATVSADFSWLVCANVCVPGRGHARTFIGIAAHPVTGRASNDVALFAAARAALPMPASGATFDEDAKTIGISIPRAAIGKRRLSGATFFPYDGAPFAQSEPERFDDGARIRITLVRSAAHAPVTRIAGVLQADTIDGDGRRSHASFVVDAVPTALVMRDVPLSLIAALAFAFAGGMLLNVMPCVFPVLSFKALGVINDHAPWKRRRLAVAYASGAIGSSAGLGVALLVLRGAGHALGWGFQWQSPVFVGSIALLVFVLALSLSGVFEIVIPLPTKIARRGARHDALGAFADGAFVTLVASSCTAPFMGSALGFALTVNPVLALGVFAALGAGIAAPYVVVTTVPAIAQRLPRPGAWMLTLRRLFAFPLYATVAWLVWVFSAQTGSNGLLALLCALVFAGFGASALGSAQSSESRPRGWNATGLAAFVVAIALVASARATARAGAPPFAAGALHFEAFTPERLAALRKHDARAFVDLTAAWCITCQVNDRLVLQNSAVERRFGKLHVTLLRGDWTNQDPQITAYLQDFGRSGVPLYAYYRTNGNVEIWPQVLTPNIVLDRLKDS